MCGLPDRLSVFERVISSFDQSRQSSGEPVFQRISWQFTGEWVERGTQQSDIQHRIAAQQKPQHAGLVYGPEPLHLPSHISQWQSAFLRIAMSKYCNIGQSKRPLYARVHMHHRLSGGKIDRMVLNAVWDGLPYRKPPHTAFKNLVGYVTRGPYPSYPARRTWR